MVSITCTGFVVPVKFAPFAPASNAPRPDPRPQFHAADAPREDERSARPLKGLGRDGGGKGADLECDRLGKGIDRGRCTAQHKAGTESEGIPVWLAAELDPPAVIAR